MDKVRQTVNAALVSRLLLVGYEFSIFDQLKTPIEVADLAKSVYCDERYLREWCEALKVGCVIKLFYYIVLAVRLFTMGQGNALFQLVR